MAGRTWTDQEHNTLRELVEAGYTAPQIARSGRLPGRSAGAIANKREELGLKSRAHERTPRLVIDREDVRVYAPDETEAEETADLLRRVTTRTGRKVARYASEGVARIRLLTDRPVALSISSDWHITTSGACEIDGLLEYADAVCHAPGAYALTVGDLLDNPVKWRKSLEQIPDDYRVLDEVLRRFGYSLLGMTNGNHDAWTVQYAGLDSLAWLADRHRIHYAPDELVYIVELASPADPETTVARYCVATRHRFRRHSNLNYTHACWRWAEEMINQWPTTEDGATIIPDIYALGHHHCAAVEARTTPNGTRWAARMGAWKTGDPHSRAVGYAKSPPTAPTFLLYPGGRIDGYADYRRALEVLEMERRDAAA